MDFKIGRRAALKAGAAGYLLKSSLRTAMLDAIHNVHRGRRHLDRDIADDDPPVKDVSSTTFGFIIAYLLPGFAGMFGISFFAPPVQELFSQFIEAESNIGRDRPKLEPSMHLNDADRLAFVN